MDALQEVIKLFNKSPKKGIAHLLEQKLVVDKPEAIAHFLLTTPKLDPKLVGDYISLRDSYNAKILSSYTEFYQFTGLEFDIAIRRFVGSSFVLPGESQQIGRIMEAFAKRYHNCNPNSIFADADAVFILAYALIMLNTDAHTAHIPKKMTLDEFVKMNRGINGGKDLPRDYLAMLYKHIVEDEIKMRTENDNSVPWADADKYGYLSKQGGKRKVWHKRWFVVKDSCLFYFKKKGAPEPLAMIPLQGLEVDKQVSKGKGKSQNFCIRLVHQDKSQKVKSCRFTDSKQVNNDVVLLLAASEQECDSWVTTLKTNLTQGLVGISGRQDASGGSSNSQGNMNSNLAPRTSQRKSVAIKKKATIKSESADAKPKPKLTRRSSMNKIPRAHRPSLVRPLVQSPTTAVNNSLTTPRGTSLRRTSPPENSSSESDGPNSARSPSARRMPPPQQGMSRIDQELSQLQVSNPTKIVRARKTTGPNLARAHSSRGMAELKTSESVSPSSVPSGSQISSCTSSESCSPSFSVASRSGVLFAGAPSRSITMGLRDGSFSEGSDGGNGNDPADATTTTKKTPRSRRSSNNPPVIESLKSARSAERITTSDTVLKKNEAPSDHAIERKSPRMNDGSAKSPDKEQQQEEAKSEAKEKKKKKAKKEHEMNESSNVKEDEKKSKETNGSQVEKEEKEEEKVVEEQEIQKKVNEQETKSQEEKKAAAEPKTPSKPPQVETEVVVARMRLGTFGSVEEAGL